MNSCTIHDADAIGNETLFLLEISQNSGAISSFASVLSFYVFQ